MTTCRFCGADGHGELAQTMQLMAQCNNCRVDIGLDGHWIGHTKHIVAELSERYPAEVIDAAMRIEFDRYNKEVNG